MNQNALTSEFPYFGSQFIRRNKTVIVEVISALLILLFVYTAINKLSNRTGFESIISRSPLIGDNAVLLSWLVPIVEIIVSFLLFLPATKKWGLLGSLALMTVFTAYVGYMIIFSPRLPCSCGGVISKMSWSQHLVFNSAFTLLALVGVILQRKPKHI